MHFVQPLLNRPLSICSLNVCGLNSKLDNGYCDLFLSEHDILCLSETKTCTYDLTETEISEFHVFTPKGYENRLFGSHGLSICIRNHLKSYFTILNGKSDNVVWLKVNKELIGIEFVLGAVYIPGEYSDYYNKDIFEYMYLDIVSFDMPLCLIGDFNSRVGKHNDIFDFDDYVARNEGLEATNIDFNENYVLNNGGNLNRCNKDGNLNNHGRRLLDMCHSLDLIIVNGRFGQDIDKGCFTCYNSMGKSTIDFSLVSPVLFNHLVDFEVEEFDDLLSDAHCAIVLSLSNFGANSLKNDKQFDYPQQNVYAYNNTNNGANNAQSGDLYFRWSNTDPEPYIESFNADIVYSLSQKLNMINAMPSQQLVDNFCNDLDQMFINNAKECGICKDKKVTSKNKKSPNHKPWYDNECAKARSEYYRVRNKIKFVNPTERNSKICAASKRLKEIIKKKKI